MQAVVERNDGGREGKFGECSLSVSRVRNLGEGSWGARSLWFGEVYLERDECPGK